MNTAKLKKLAEAATSGPWHIRTNRHPNTDGTSWGWLDLYEQGSMRQALPEGVQVTWSRGRQSDSNAKYIAAANPAAILKLLAINAELVEALNDAATSLETINRLAGKASYGVDEDGPIPTYMGHHDEVRAYAGSRAGCARAALAKAEGGEL